MQVYVVETGEIPVENRISETHPLLSESAPSKKFCKKLKKTPGFKAEGRRQKQLSGEKQMGNRSCTPTEKECTLWPTRLQGLTHV